MAEIVIGSVTLFSAPLIYLYSRNRYDINSKKYNELQVKVVELNLQKNPTEIEDGTLVYINSKYKLETTLIKDPILGLTFENIPGLKRRVKMYQYGATSQDSKGKELPNNNTEWCETRLNNSKNFNSFPFSTKEFFSSGMTIGNFKFSSEFMKNHSNFDERIHLTSKDIKSVPLLSFDENTHQKNSERLSNEKENPNWENRLKTTRSGNLEIVLNEMDYQVGDLRVTYYTAGSKSGEATILGRKNGSTIDTYNDSECGSIFYFNYGSKSVNEIFDSYRDDAYKNYVFSNIISGVFFLTGSVILSYVLANKNKK